MNAPSPLSPLRLVVLISGGGTTLRNLIEKIATGELDARIELVISSNPSAGGLAIAAAAGIPTRILERRSFTSNADYGAAVFDACRAVSPHLVVMAGFLKFCPVPDDFAGRVVNIHPSLIPAFCGHGMYGLRVHQAVLEAGARVTGCTVHFVDNQYDHGPIILQRTVPVLDDDTPEILAARVFEAECEAYPDALRLFAGGRLRLADGKVVVAGRR
ncbi:MAG TPA: phosphoribosylglycinamide formyltransferase [Pirellulales bacterium]|nr:phosphoribosylglycinamide formyltransferase [Pirellulales bacterium]